MRILWKLCTNKITKMKQKSSSNNANCQPWLKKIQKRKPNSELLSNKYSQTKANAHEALVVNSVKFPEDSLTISSSKIPLKW